MQKLILHSHANMEIITVVTKGCNSYNETGFKQSSDLDVVLICMSAGKHSDHA